MRKLHYVFVCSFIVILYGIGSVRGDTSEKIVFTEEQSNKLHIVTPGGPPAVILLSDLYNVIFPHWSPDEQWITFTANPIDDSTGSQVYMIRSDGSGLHRVTDGSGNLSCPSFSPDGSKILFSQVYGNLFTINVNRTNQTNLGVLGGHAEWSPDGTKISYTNWGLTYESDIFVYDTVSQTSTQLTYHQSSEAFIEL